MFEWRCSFGSAGPPINDELTDSWRVQSPVSCAKINISFSRVYVKSISLASHLIYLDCLYHYGDTKIHGIEFDWYKLSLTWAPFKNIKQLKSLHW